MSPCDILVNAVVTNPQQAAELLDLVESVFHIPAKLFDSNGTIAYEGEIKTAENLARKLGWAIEDYRLEIDGAWEGRLKGAGPKSGELKAKLHSTATSHYWTAIEKNLGLLMAHIEAIGTDKAIPSQEEWQRMLFKSACDAYRVACGQETSRQIKAFAKGWQKLTFTKDEPESDTIATEEGNQ
jgi:CRISPR system Cascade subunit CasA